VQLHMVCAYGMGPQQHSMAACVIVALIIVFSLNPISAGAAVFGCVRQIATYAPAACRAALYWGQVDPWSPHFQLTAA
jgi:hypothetical protein